MLIDISVKVAATLKQTRGLDEREVHTIKSSNIKGHFPHEFHAKNVLFIHSHQPDSLEMDFSNQPDNLYYLLFSARMLGYVNRLYLVVTIFFLWISEVKDCHSITLLEFYFLSSLYIKHILGAIFILVTVIVAL